jgi:REP element-mobilizing transposase RayT
LTVAADRDVVAGVGAVIMVGGLGALADLRHDLEASAEANEPGSSGRPAEVERIRIFSFSLQEDRHSYKHSPIKMARRSHQLVLSLPAPRRWGGRRDGAGRKPKGSSSGMPHGRRAHFGTPLPAHVTLRVRADVPSLRTVAIVHEIERSFADGCARPGFRLAHYSLQSNHAHLVVEARDRHALGRGMKSIAARLARAVNRIAERSGPVLVERYHLRLLSTPKEVRNALRYVLLNARRHLAKLGRTLPRIVQLDPASSGRFFFGWNRRFQPASSLHPPPVSSPHTWLLSIGWRRYGLIDPTEIPGPRGA